MNPQRHAKVKEIFLAACNVPPDRRAQFVGQQCGGDQDLKNEVEKLLQAHSETQEPSPSPGSDDRTEHVRHFPAGHLVARRYRIVELLGRGGMAEVYRADDTRVGQQVALKFLLSEHSADPRWRTQLCQEVRLARQITHRNVCRIFDVTESGSELFISMEFVTGENLRSLLHRIGRISREKALEIASQMCAGLAAAHAQGVLHRDLKPANVMIDGRGQVKIMDFGLAGIAGEIRRREIRSGTPAYMAPEQRAGREVSVRSDIYALGLVLHELFTGKPAFPAQADDGSIPPAPSMHEANLDPSVERVIRQCLEPDPRNRPSSVLDVAAALPGNSPLTATLAAGLTPSPTVVAAVQPTESISFPRGVAAVAAAAVMLVFVHLLSPLANPVLQAPGMKSPQVLTEKAQEMTRQLLSDLTPADEAKGLFDASQGALAAAPPISQTSRRDMWGLMGKQSLAFWYRTSSQPLVPSDPENVVFANAKVTPQDPVLSGSRAAMLMLDGRGNLRAAQVAPAAPGSAPASPAAEHWPAWFKFAGLDMGAFKAAEPRWSPTVWYDQHQAWVQKDPAPGIRVEAATYQGRPAFFAVGEDRRQTDSDRSLASPDVRRTFLRVLRQSLLWISILVSLPLAWVNVRGGSSDLRGAFRLAVFVFCLRMAAWVLQTHYLPGFSLELRQVGFGAMGALIVAGGAYLFYLALEPYVRRFWPHAIVSWTRLLAARGLDPQVGGDILVGTVLGIFWALIFRLDRWLALALNLGARDPIRPPDFYSSLMGPGQGLAGILRALGEAITEAGFFLMLVVFLRMLLGRPRPAFVLAFVLIAPIYVPLGSHPAVSWIALGIGGVGAGLWVLTRFGIVPLVIALFLVQILNRTPLTLSLRAWYADVSGLTLLVTAGLVTLGFFVSQRKTPD